MRNLSKDQRGVFGLTAVQSFFGVILGIALLAYVIVIIMGTLNTSTILPSYSSSVSNETVVMTGSAVNLGVAGHSLTGCSATVTAVSNATANIPANNYTVSGCTIVNKTSLFGSAYAVTYGFTTSSVAQLQTNSILTNTSSGITAFFGAINPIYAILAILVIILVLVVLVRVVQAPTSGAGGTPQL